MKHVLIVLALLCSLCLHAKGVKIKYGKNVIKYGKTVVYEGLIVDKQPKGQGVLSLLRYNNNYKKETYFTIKGFFDGNNITDAECYGMNIAGMRVGSVNVIYGNEHDNYNHDIQVILNNCKLHLNTSSGMMYSLKQCFNSNIPIASIDKLVLHCTNSSKYASDSIILTISSDYINKIDPTVPSSKLHYDNSSVDKVEFIVKNPSAGLLERQLRHMYWVMKDGARFYYNTITYPNGDKIEISYDKEGWTGTRNFSDGTKITSKKGNNSYIVNITKPKAKETYTGTLKDIFAPLYPKSTYAFYTGTQNINGVTTKWIDGERLKDKLEPVWLAMVEAGMMSDEEAFEKQKTEMAEKEREMAKKKREEEAKKREEYLKKHPEKRLKYHEVGKMENCSWCAGTGRHLLRSNMVCGFCGGKGWYIEHYW